MSSQIGKSENKFKAVHLLLLLGIILFILFIFAANLLHFNYKMNADNASEVVLAKLIWDSGRLTPETWYSSTETRIISTPNIAALFYGMTRNASLSMGFACCFMTVGIIISICYFMHTIHFNNTDKLLMIFLSLMLPCSFVSLELLYLYASYYAIHVITLFLTLGFYSSYITKKSINRFVYIVLAVLSFLLGLQGVRGMLITFGPLFCIEVVRSITLLLRTHKFDKYNRNVLLSVSLLLVTNYVGTCFPFSVGPGISRNLRNGISKLVFTVLPDAGSAIGFEYTSLYGKSILIILCLPPLAILVHTLYKIFNGNDLETAEWSFLILAVSPILTILMVSFTTIESTERYYFILLFLIALSAVLTAKTASTRTAYCFYGIIMALALINIHHIYIPVLSSDEPPQSDALAVVSYLSEREYFTAYASFDNANTMTVLSNNEIIVAAVADVSKMNICKWMSSTQWYVPNRPYNEKTAYIITESEKEAFLYFLEQNKYNDYITTECKIGKYWIYSSPYNYSSLD